MSTQWEKNSRFGGNGNLHFSYDPEIKSTFKSRADIRFLNVEERHELSKLNDSTIAVLCIQVFLRTAAEVDCVQTRINISRKLPFILGDYMVPNKGRIITVVPQKKYCDNYNAEVQIHCCINAVPSAEAMISLKTEIDKAIWFR